jgi:hypothetical protein
MIRKLFCIIGLFAALTMQAQDLKDGLLVYYSMDGKIANEGGKKVKHELHTARKVADRNGKAESALEFYTQKGIYKRGLWVHLNINPDSFPVLCITAWVKPAQTFGRLNVCVQGDDKDSRGIVTAKNDGYYCWAVQTGSGGALTGPRLTTDWVFLAAMYDARAEQVRFIANNKLYKSHGKQRKGQPILTIGNFEGMVDELRIYKRFLTLPELEQLYGNAIEANPEDLVVKPRRNFRKEKEFRQLAALDSLKVRVVVADELIVKDSIKGTNSQDFLKKGDTLTIVSHDGSTAIVTYHGNKKGQVRCKTLISDTFPAGTTGWMVWLSFHLSGLFDYTSGKSWIIIGVIAILLFMAMKYFRRIDRIFTRFARHDEFSAGAAKGSGIEIIRRKSFLRRIFPLKRYNWWPMSIGILTGSALFIFAIWDDGELEWFMNGGGSFIPSPEFLPIHWAMWGVFIFIMLMFVVMIIESAVIAGPVGGVMRVVYLIVMNLLSLVVTFYVFLLIMAIIAVIIGLYVLAAMGSGTRYRCTRCGRVFTGSSCPNCG